ncbi:MULTISPECIES: bifunctional DNA primase/polymerase [Streptomyces]|uniref:DNA primase n=1 Tax=Streptomyces cacaoi TaxID=1898 RepID=A0A4Y3R3Z6_STRCI|nr:MULTISPECIES: bifunctional DNA primase/polymerase [Streptomyces]NNG88032.1 bifunctional DNA primase/polymerase [Streptomyces cacaoi]QHF92632.1 DNA primase [Streptomyces sp. NHF165]GEB50650.1 DNA primase [Streptomyces cacaoi]
MREILGRRRFPWSRGPFAARAGSGSGRHPHGSPMRSAALTAATQWRWPVVPGAGPAPDGPGHAAGQGGTGPALCACRDPECVVPGAHPFDPVLLAATTEPGMVRWWWDNRPQAPLVVATGGTAVSALSLPAVAGARALARFEATGVRLGPVVATPTRFSVLVAPYAIEELGELLYAQDLVPSSLRFHGDGGYIVLPPSRTGSDKVRWERSPEPGPSGRPWLPRLESLLDVLVEESVATPDTGSRLAY